MCLAKPNCVASMFEPGSPSRCYEYYQTPRQAQNPARIAYLCRTRAVQVCTKHFGWKTVDADDGTDDTYVWYPNIGDSEVKEKGERFCFRDILYTHIDYRFAEISASRRTLDDLCMVPAWWRVIATASAISLYQALHMWRGMTLTSAQMVWFPARPR